MNTIVNGHEAETGCYAGGHRGWYAPQRVIELAIGFGWELDDEGEQAVNQYFSDDNTEDLFEIVVGQGGIADEAVDWLNDNTNDGFLWHWSDGEFFLSPNCGADWNDPRCDNDECVCHAD